MSTTGPPPTMPPVAIIGAGPAALVAAIAMARRGQPCTIFERDEHPEDAPRFNPERSYTIDITGHGARAVAYIEGAEVLNRELIPFKGVKLFGRMTEQHHGPGWTGSRGDILRALTSIIDQHHLDLVTVRYETQVNDVDVVRGTVTSTNQHHGTDTDMFDLVIGADGAGSTVRDALARQLPDFSVTMASLPNYCVMLELDQVDGQLDPNYLHALSLRPAAVAGAINGTGGPSDPRWLCMIGSGAPMTFSGVNEVREFLRRSPKVLELASETALANFANRPCHHIGKSATCSSLYGYRAVLLGDAAAPFPPIGQGVNAAMESAMVLDTAMADSASVTQAAARYDNMWRPEARAVSWISKRAIMDNPIHIARGAVTTPLGLSIFGQAKRADLSYTQVKARAERLWPLWR